MGTLTDQYLVQSGQLYALCQKYKVVKLCAFGSVLTDRFNPATSDIDLTVTFAAMPPEEYADNFFDLLDALQLYFNRKVDLIEEKMIKNPYLKESIEQQKRQLYAA